MKNFTYLSTHDVKELLFGIPKNHKHCRLIIKTDQNQGLIFSEALVAAIVRSYMSVKTHPTRMGVEMAQTTVENHKDDFAAFQLLETGKNDMNIQLEISDYID